MALSTLDPKTARPREAFAADSLARFWTTRYWPAWLLIGWLRITASMPWRLAIKLHKGIGRACWLLLPRHRRTVERNIGLCFPRLSSIEVRALVRQHFENLAACLAETAFAWFGKVDESLAEFRFEGDEHVYAALAAGRGVILYTGHFTPVEICAPILKDAFPLFGFMFHPRRNPLLNEIQRRGRRYGGHLSFPNNNVRAMLQALRRNAVVWYAPDQSHAQKSSSTLNFFGGPATVTTATCRIARASGAAIVPFAYRRLSADTGYLLRFDPAVEMPVAESEEDCTRRLLGILEAFIRSCPEQYAWTHKRLRHRPAELPEQPGQPQATESQMSLAPEDCTGGLAARTTRRIA